MSRLMWRKAKLKTAHWLHVRSNLSGEKDSAKCSICHAEVDLEQPPRTRESVLTEFTRKHFYKHKFDQVNV